MDMDLWNLIGFGCQVYKRVKEGRGGFLISFCQLWIPEHQSGQGQVSKSANIWGSSTALVVDDSTVVCRTSGYDPNSGLQS